MLPDGPYKPIEYELEIYKFWEEKGYFNPDNCDSKETYSIVLPPPNVTGVLHLGHALTIAIEDILIRYNRMLGKKTLWLPGTDHAAIATQSKVEKLLYKKEKKSRYDFGRDEFLKKVEDFAQASHDTIVAQAKKMGASLDWSREAYTLDEQRNFAVRTAFKQMYDDGLIYRGDRVVNWDPKGQTTVSDEEVEHVERDAKMYTFKYTKDFPIAISTTRPETKVGDTAVAVHPDDERYKKYVGQEFEFEFCGVPVKVKVIDDKEVDPEFGTGALGVTPAHSAIDWEMAQRHDLPLVQVIDERRKMMVGEKLVGKKVEEAREIIVEWLKENDLFIKQENIKQNVSISQRTGGVIEPLPKKQWFVDVSKKFKVKSSKLKGIKVGQEVSLKELMCSVVDSGKVNILPDRFTKIYFNWIDNLRDWCISRQIWYGHQIPVWYRPQKHLSTETLNHNNKEEIYVGIDAPEGKGWEQDPDTLDTWFSSGLWTFSTLGWPEVTEDLKNFHPTDVLETGYDILFFWVARMILMTTYFLGEVPFKTVFLHGLVRDADKQKMSKSTGNAIDPLEVTEKYGTDALRMALIFSTGQGSDIVFGDDKIVAQRKFTNKIWNASKFVLNNIDESVLDVEEVELNLNDADKDILEKLDLAIKNITENIDKFMFHEAAQEVYHFFWDEFCDKEIENTKDRLNADNDKSAFASRDRKTAQFVLHKVLLNSLKLLHPFMPFITELVWKEIPKKENKALIVSSWPSVKK